jgi:hypothetical protein
VLDEHAALPLANQAAQPACKRGSNEAVHSPVCSSSSSSTHQGPEDVCPCDNAHAGTRVIHNGHTVDLVLHTGHM